MSKINPTSLQHAGKEHRVGRGLIGATETSVTFQSESVDDSPVYSRLGNTSNHREVERLLAATQGARDAIVTGSGMAAFNLLFQTLLRPGDHILVQECCYGGTFNYIEHILRPWGVMASVAPVSDWGRYRQANTKLALFESISNPFCSPLDVRSAAGFCRSAGILSVCDNTFASPVLCRPLDSCVDFVLESATKYLNGHSDVIAGVIAGNSPQMAELRKIHAYLGTFLPPQQCAMLVRGLKTLELRVKKISENGKAFAAAMSSHTDLVEQVYYGSDDPDILKCFSDGFGGMVTVRFKKHVDVKSMMRSMSLVSDVPSLGGTESSATMPSFTTNWFMAPEAKLQLGIDDKLVRFSIGLESPEDISADVLAAIALKTKTRP